MFDTRYARKQTKALAAVVAVLLVGWGAAVAPAASARTSSTPSPPFTQCPAIGSSPSCQILLVVNPDNSVSVLGDPSVGPFDGSDDTLVGILNNSSASVSAVTVSGPGSGLSGFDGDGICSGDYGTWSGSSACPYGSTGYEGPGTSFVTSASLPDSAEVDFTGGLAQGASAYFSLEGALDSAQLTAVKGPLGSFTVNGTIPVAGNSSQDTHTAGTKCSLATFLVAKAAGAAAVVTLRRFKHAPVAADLLKHFLAGTGSSVPFADSSSTAAQVLGDPDFTALDAVVQSAVLSQLNSGITQVQLTNSTLRTVTLTATPDLYYGFRGTQGLIVAGQGEIVGGNYVGTLTYTIEDSYGFSKADAKESLKFRLMRYLQTNCGKPPHKGGAHWFPDSITVTVDFNEPVG